MHNKFLFFDWFAGNVCNVVWCIYFLLFFDDIALFSHWFAQMNFAILDISLWLLTVLQSCHFPVVDFLLFFFKFPAYNRSKLAHSPENCYSTFGTQSLAYFPCVVFVNNFMPLNFNCLCVVHSMCSRDWNFALVSPILDAICSTFFSFFDHFRSILHKFYPFSALANSP